MSILINGTELGNSIALNNTDLSEIIFNGVTVWKRNSPVTEELTWQQIYDAIIDGTFYNYEYDDDSIPFSKSFVIGGKTYHAMIASINEGRGNGVGWYPNRTVDFICTELYETSYPYNTVRTNSGGFPSSELRSTLENTIYPLLPSDLRDKIISKSHSYIISTDGTMATDSTKLWLPTHYEIAGTVDEYAPGETYTNNKKYSNLVTQMKSLNGQSSNSDWWTGSIYSKNKYNFWFLNDANGGLGGRFANLSIGVPICFRIGHSSKDLGQYSWTQIQSAIKNGTFSTFASVGDTKSFVMNGKTYNAEVVSINDGTGSAAQWYPNKTVDFICKELYETKYVFDSDEDTVVGFPNSDLKDVLNNILYPLLPTDLKNVIIGKTHLYNINQSGEMASLTTKLWLPTCFEVRQDVLWENTKAPGETASNNKKYVLASYEKSLNGGSPDGWWIGSLPSELFFNQVMIESLLGYDSSSEGYLDLGVPICFRIG